MFGIDQVFRIARHTRINKMIIIGTKFYGSSYLGKREKPTFLNSNFIRQFTNINNAEKIDYKPINNWKDYLQFIEASNNTEKNINILQLLSENVKPSNSHILFKESKFLELIKSIDQNLEQYN